MATLIGMRFHDNEGGDMQVVIGSMVVAGLRDSEFKISIYLKPTITLTKKYFVFKFFGLVLNSR